MKHARGTAEAVHVLRLAPGSDLRLSLLEWCRTGGIEAACVLGAVGSLGPAVLRYAGASEGHTMNDDLEVIALSGTLAMHGIHLHALVSDGEGRTTGGHVLAGCVVRTTMEVVVQTLGGIRLARVYDPRTGHAELDPTDLP